MKDNNAITSLCSSPLMQFIAFAGLILLSNAGLRHILDTRFADFSDILNIAVRVVILVILIALVYPQFTGRKCCKDMKKDAKEDE